jgi:hypothetical protein
MRKSRPAKSGCGPLEVSAGSNLLVAFAAKGGTVTEDGEQSLFTQAILQSLTVPGLDVRLSFGRIRDQVMKASNNRQEPFVYGSLGGGNVSLAPSIEGLAAAANLSSVKADYDLVAQIGTKRAFEIFLTAHKTGFYAELARAQLAELAKREKPDELDRLRTQLDAANKRLEEEHRARTAAQDEVRKLERELERLKSEGAR